MPAADAVGTAYDLTLDATEFAAMLVDNQGMVLRQTSAFTGSAFICSSDHATAAYRPKLVIDYTLPGGGTIFASSIFHSAIMGGTIAR